MDVALKKSKIKNSPEIAISGSKSETNRLLLLQALYPEIALENASQSDDSTAMRNALTNNHDIINVGHAGTAMRFLTAYFAIQEDRTVILTGSDRMQQRPIGILVNALKQLGANIDYLEKVGFPPLKITGAKITANQVSLRADVSSQFISALLLIASKLENGLKVTLEGHITSKPYIDMSLALLNEIGVEASFKDNLIEVKPMRQLPEKQVCVESDWSSASYFYSIVALSDIGAEISLSTFKKNSFQGDAALVSIYETLGVETRFEREAIIVRKIENAESRKLRLSLNDNPDLAQTVAVTAFGLGIACHLSGLHTLKIKETDRLSALKTELEKLGATVSITDDSLEITPAAIQPGIQINTYDDHRMAMAFAPLAIKVPIVIRNAEVVSKSYSEFWNDLKLVGFTVENT
jgi:3-phosphoshikimate 1-carboxyvinyltransferase